MMCSLHGRRGDWSAGTDLNSVKGVRPEFASPRLYVDIEIIMRRSQIPVKPLVPGLSAVNVTPYYSHHGD